MSAARKKSGPGVHTGKVCGAKTHAAKRQGSPCQQPAGWGTTHLGYGACKLHLGSTKLHTAKAEAEMVQDELRRATGVPVLVGQADRDTIRHVGRAVIAALDLTPQEDLHARQVLEREITALQTVTVEEARRIDQRERDRRKRSTRTAATSPEKPKTADVPTAEEYAELDQLAQTRRVVRRRKKNPSNPQEDR